MKKQDGLILRFELYLECICISFSSIRCDNTAQASLGRYGSHFKVSTHHCGEEGSTVETGSRVENNELMMHTSVQPLLNVF